MSLLSPIDSMMIRSDECTFGEPPLSTRRNLLFGDTLLAAPLTDSIAPMALDSESGTEPLNDSLLALANYCSSLLSVEPAEPLRTAVAVRRPELTSSSQNASSSSSAPPRADADSKKRKQREEGAEEPNKRIRVRPQESASSESNEDSMTDDTPKSAGLKLSLSSISQLSSDEDFSELPSPPTTRRNLDTASSQSASAPRFVSMADVDNRKRKRSETDSVDDPNKRAKFQTPEEAGVEESGENRSEEDTAMLDESAPVSATETATPPKPKVFTFSSAHILLSKKELYLGDFKDFSKSIEKICIDCQLIHDVLKHNRAAVLDNVAQNPESRNHFFFTKDLTTMSKEITSFKKVLKKAFPYADIKDDAPNDLLSSCDEIYTFATNLLGQLSQELEEAHKALYRFVNLDRKVKNKQAVLKVDRWIAFLPEWRVFSEKYWAFNQYFFEIFVPTPPQPPSSSSS